VAVDVFEDAKRAVAHVEEHQLSLAIGKRGQNVRLAAKLTGWRIDIVKAGEEAQTEVEAGAQPEEAAKESPAAEEAMDEAVSDPAIVKDENPAVGEGTEEAAMNPADKEADKETGAGTA
jgi:transcription antitermination factor NusA-like protein